MNILHVTGQAWDSYEQLFINEKYTVERRPPVPLSGKETKHVRGTEAAGL